MPGRRVGVEFLVAQARARPGELTLVATGPLHGVALALQLEPRLPALVAGARAMGARARARAGNVSPLAEANLRTTRSPRGSSSARSAARSRSTRSA